MKKLVWKRVWARKYSPYFASFFIEAYPACKNKLFLPEGNLNALYFSQSDFKELVEDYLSYLLNQDLELFALNYESEFKKLLSWAQKINKIDFRKQSNAELIKMLNELRAKMIKSAEVQLKAFIVLEGPCKELERTLSDNKKKDKILRYISEPYKTTEIQRAKIELLKLAINGRMSDKELTQYWHKYAWIPMYEFVDSPWQIEDIRNQLKGISEPDDKLNNLIKEHQENLKNYDLILKELKGIRLIKLAKITHCFAYLKEMRDDYRRKAFYFLRPFWEEVSNRLKIDLVQSNFLLHSEIIACLEKDTNLFKSEITKRQKCYSLILNEGKLSINSKDLSEKFLEEIEVNDKYLKGMTAYSGKVQGNVSIIYHQGEFNKFVSGNILVTTMTHPEFFPIMRQAKAIVTDEGGITCHAAIVARELKIPCVIGTKIATKILKDGDIVEVDANKGIVRRI